MLSRSPGFFGCGSGCWDSVISCVHVVSLRDPGSLTEPEKGFMEPEYLTFFVR